MSVRTTFCHVEIITPDLSWAGRPSRTLRWTGRPGDELRGLIAVQAQIAMRVGSSRFVLHFAPEAFERESIADVVPANSLVFIEMGSSDDHDDDPTIIVGLTSEPAEDEVFLPNASQRAITIPGRGLDAVLAEAGIYRNPALATRGPAYIEQLAKDLSRLTQPAETAAQTGGRVASWMGLMWLAGVDPRDAIARVLHYLVSDEASTVINLRLPGRQSLADLLTAGGQLSTDPAVQAWVRDFSARVERAKASGANQAATMREAAALRCPIPSEWTLLRPDLMLPVVSINPSAGSVLDIIHAAVDPVFHELYPKFRRRRCDIMFGVLPFARPEQIASAPTGTQFDVDAIFEDRPHTVVITTGDLVGRQSLRRGMPVSNLWHVLPGGGATVGSTAAKNMADPAISDGTSFSDFMRFGLRPKEVSIPYLPSDYLGGPTDGVESSAQTRATKLRDLVVELNRTLKAWEDPHPFMWTGSISMQGRAVVRPGTRLVWRGEDIHGRPDGRPTREFWVEGTSHSYQFGTGDYTTTAQVSRGWQIP